MFFVIGAAFIGLSLGTMGGGLWLVPRGSGLAGPVIALGYGTIGAVAGACVATLATRILVGAILRRLVAATLIITMAMAVVLTLRWQQAQAEHTDPNQAYDGLPSFQASVQQLIITDPYLATRAGIDTTSRSWSLTLPDGRECRGTLRAQAQKHVGDVLSRLAQVPTAEIRNCSQSSATAEQRLSWKFDGSTRASVVDVSAECLAAKSAIANAIGAIRNVNVRSTSNVECD